MPDFEDVKFEMIGRGGTKEDVPLIDQTNEALYEAALAAANPETDGKATVTIRVTLKRGDEGGILHYGSVSVKNPVRRTKALLAFVEDDGRVTTRTHKQLALDQQIDQMIDNVTPIKTKKAE